MTDRIKGLVITLDNDYRIDDLENLINAIEQFRGVASVSPSVASTDDHINRSRIKLELKQKLYEAID